MICLPQEHKGLKKMNSKLSKKKRRMENENKADSDNYHQLPNEDEHILDGRKPGRTKRNHTKTSTCSQTLSETDGFVESKEANSETKSKNKKVKKDSKSKKKDLQGRKTEEMLGGVQTEMIDEIPSVSDDHSGEMKTDSMIKSDRTLQSQSVGEIGTLIESKEANSKRKRKTKKGNKNAKTIKEDFQGKKSEESASEANADMVDELSSIDEDSSRGMKKWLSEYKQRRPGLKILQQRIDEFITVHEEKQEQERKDKEERAAEGGWTVVVHHKGRKKTTDTESGITVGSVAQAAVMDKMAKKKSKEVPVDFYRFQKREAKRNEVMMLQSKFEQDKKRIQQLRAARKFRPY